MKKYTFLALSLSALMALSACGSSSSPAATEAPATEAPVVTEAPAATETPAATEAPVVTEAPVEETSDFEKAYALIGHDVQELYDAIGEPLSKEEYAKSCLGAGDDGMFNYDGFTVYTYREGDSETVQDVLEN